MYIALPNTWLPSEASTAGEIPTTPLYDPNFVPPPTGKFVVYLYTEKNLQKLSKYLT